MRGVAHRDRAGQFATALGGDGDGVGAGFVDGQVGRLLAGTPQVGGVFAFHFEGGEGAGANDGFAGNL